MKTLLLFLSLIATINATSSNLLVGDSQTASIAANSKLVVLESLLCKNGCNVSDLIVLLESYTENVDAKNVFISIGTNSGFSSDDNIERLIKKLTDKFPKAKFFVIKGSYGWGNNKNIIEDTLEDYYLRFWYLRVKIVHTGIGYSVKHPDNKTPTIVKIGEEIDSLINGR